jgi:two-component system response regulator DevR
LYGLALFIILFLENRDAVTVLVVEDSELVREKLVSAIGEIPGVRVVKVGNVRQARQAVVEDRPDLVLLDIRLPDGSGIDVLKEIRNERRTAVVVILTNYATEQYREKCMTVGASFFFDKSTESEKAIEVIRGMSEELQR